MGKKKAEMQVPLTYYAFPISAFCLLLLLPRRFRLLHRKSPNAVAA